MDKVKLRENYQIGDISRFKNDYHLKRSGKDGEQEVHTISYTSQEVIDILEDGRIEIVTTVENIEILKGDSEPLILTGSKEKNFLPPPESAHSYPKEALKIGSIWEMDRTLLLSPQIKWPSGNTIPMIIYYTLEGLEEVHKTLCAKIKLDSSLVIDVPGQTEPTQQIRNAGGYNYFGLEEGKLFKATSTITNLITAGGRVEMRITEDLIIDLIDFDWN